MQHNDESPSCSKSNLHVSEVRIGDNFDDIDNPFIIIGNMKNQVEVINNEQPLQIMKFIGEFRNADLLCDVELEVGDEIIKAHRCILAASSPYFRAMFTNGMIEMKKDRIKLNDITKESMKMLIDYIYSNEITVTSENVQNLLFAASILQMDNIVEACQDFLRKTITVSSCLALRQFAEIYNCTQLINATEDFAVDNFSALRKREDFYLIPLSQLESLLWRDDLNVNEEKEVFEAVMDWISYDEPNRIQNLTELFKVIRLPLLGCTFLVQIVNHNRYIKCNPKCRDMVSEALLQLLVPQKSSTPSSPEKSTSSGINDIGCGQYAASSMTTSENSLNLASSLNACNMKTTRPRKSVAGVIFCAGGRGTLGDPFRSVEAYDWRTNSWFSIADMTVQRRHVGVVSALGELYAIGGHDGVTHLSSAEVYNPATGVWRRISPMASARRGIAVATLDAAIYAVGGLDDSRCFKTVERYDIELNEWSQVSDMTIQRGGVGVAAMGKYLFAVGGNDGTSSLDSCERFDPLLDRWRSIARMHNRRAGAGVCVLDGFLYAIGGFDDNAPLATCEKYNIEEDCWHPISNMNNPRGGVGVAAMGGCVYAIGGHDGTRYLNTVERYDPVVNQWMPVCDIKESRAGAGVAWADCRISHLKQARNQCDSGYAPSSGSNCI